MTAMTLPVSATVRPDARLGFGRVVRSEWIKLTSLRSTWWSLALIVVLGVGISLLMASTVDWSLSTEPAGAAGLALTIATVGLTFGQLIAAVLGVLVMSGEYSTGMIRSTLAAVPTRLPVLAAKSIVLFLLVTVVGALTIFGAWAATYPILDAQGVAAGLGSDGLALALAGGAAYLGLTALFALGLGTLLRAAAGGIAAALGIILVVPIVLPLLAMAIDWVAELSPFLFSSAGSAMASLPTEAGFAAGGVERLDPWVGALVVVAWSAVSLVLGAIALARRDA